MANGLFNLKQVNQAVRQSAWVSPKPPAVDYLVVAGGGSNGAGGAGGAGGLLTGNVPVTAGSAITVTVGAGGTDNNSLASNGSNSVFGSILTSGGGGGASTTGSNWSQTNGFAGGSGGGGCRRRTTSGNNGTSIGGQGVFNQGNAGGNGTNAESTNNDLTQTNSGGGGGAGTVGINGNVYIAGTGGTGGACNIAGLAVYAGGGGGSTWSGAVGDGGVGGGGNSTNGYAAAANTGGGGPYGGSGIVSISYPVAYAAAASTTGSPNVMISGSGAVQFSGKNYVTWPVSTSALYLGANDFTLEAWVYPTASGASQLLFCGQSDLGTVAGSAYYFPVGTSSNADIYVGTTTYSATAPNPTTNQWSHVVVARTGSVMSTYLNGTRVGTVSVSGTVNTGATTYKPSTGGISNVAGGANFTGYISNLRLIVGSGGYNAANSTITVPTSPLTATANTKLLVFQDGYSPYKDASTSATPAGYGFNQYYPNNMPRGTFLTPFASSTYTNIARVYEWTSSGSITF